MPLYDEGLSRAKEWVNSYMMNNLAPNLATGGVIPPTTDMGPMGAPNQGMNLPSPPSTKTPGKSTTPTAGVPNKAVPVPVPPRPQETISMGQLSSVPDYVARFLVDLSRKIMGLPEGGIPTGGGIPTENPAMGLPSSPSQGYRVAEGGKPEVVNAEGAYYPFESGQVTPLIPRREGGPVEPSETRYVEQYNRPKPYDPFNPPSNIIDTGIKIPTQIGTPGIAGRVYETILEPSVEATKELGRELYGGYQEHVGQPFSRGITEPIASDIGYMATGKGLPERPFDYTATIPSYTGPRPWRNIPTTPTPTPTPPPSLEGLSEYGITKGVLPTGETRYTLPGTEGTMTLPSGWDATAEGQKVFGAMKPGYYKGVGEPMALPTTEDKGYYATHPEERAMDIEALGTAPLRGMAEYEATVARGKMTRRERREAGVADRELRKQALIGKGALDVAKLQYGPTSPESQQHLAYAEHLRGLTPTNLQMEQERTAAHLQGVRETIAGHLKVAGITAEQKDPIYKGAYTLLNTLARQAGQGFPVDVTGELSNFFKMSVAIGDMTPAQYDKLPPEYKQKISRQQAIQLLKDNKLPMTERNIQHALTQGG